MAETNRLRSPDNVAVPLGAEDRVVVEALEEEFEKDSDCDSVGTMVEEEGIVAVAEAVFDEVEVVELEGTLEEKSFGEDVETAIGATTAAGQAAEGASEGKETAAKDGKLVELEGTEVPLVTEVFVSEVGGWKKGL